MTTKLSPNSIRPFLKWAGGKFRLMPLLRHYFLQHPNSLLVEPFVGAGAVFLNSFYAQFILNDLNKDIINLYTILKKNNTLFILEAKKLFDPKYNKKNIYLDYRKKFNQSVCSFERSLLFLYLNRHGFNGLCRYNQSLQFNVPFGQFLQPYFPEKELLFFIKQVQNASFSDLDFSLFFKELILKIETHQLPKSILVYCDPPYVPLNKTARFTQYAGTVFNEEQHISLAFYAKQLAQLGATVMISNHDTPFTRNLYAGERILSFEVGRTISCDANKRTPAKELLAIFNAKKKLINFF